MKRVILHKAMPAVADCTDSSTPNEQPKQAQRNQLPSNSGKAGASVAMIGLAMSVGASSLLLPQTGDAAIAVEPLISNESATDQLLGSPSLATPKTLVDSGPVTNVTESQEPLRLATSHRDQSVWLSNHQVPQNKTVEILQAKSMHDLGPNGAYIPIIPDVLPESQQNQKSEKNTNDWSGSILSRLRGNTSSDALPHQSVDKGILETAGRDVIDSAADETMIKSIENAGNILEASGPHTTLNQGNKSSVIQLETETDENTYHNGKDSDVKLLDSDDQAINKSTLDKAASNTSENNRVEALKDEASITNSISTNNDHVLETNNLLGAVSLPPISTPEIVAIKSESDRTTYRVRAGDTLDEIAQKYAVSVSDLIAINQILDPNYLLPGQSLTIPGSFKSGDGFNERVEIAIPQPADLQVASNQSLPERGEVVISTDMPSAIAQTNLPSTVPVDSNGLVIPMGGDSAEIVSEPQIVNEPTLAQPEIIAVNPINSSESDSSFSEAEPVATQKSPYNDRLNADLARLKATSEPVAIAVEVPQVPVTPTQIDLQTRQKEISRPEQQLLTRREVVRRGELSRREAIQPTEVRIVTPNVGNIQVTPNVISANVDGSYDRFNNLSINRMVSPDLPPLLSPDAYLPGNNGGYLPRHQNQPISNGGYIWPAEGVLTSGYGWRWGRMHRGIDIAAPIGTPIYAAKEGEVVFADWNDGGYGYMVEIRHPDGSNTIYAHNDRLLVQKGQTVEQGQQISEMGTTGRSTGPHLHFEIDPDGQGAVDPLAYLPNNRSN